MTWQTLKELAIPAALVVGGVIVGLAVRRYIVGRLVRLAHGTASDLDDVAAEQLRGPVVLWGAILGLYLAVGPANLPAGAQRIVQRVLIALMVASVTLAAARLVGALLQRRVTRATGLTQSASLIENTARVAVLAVGGLVLLQTLGISITPIVTALGVGGLAVALALQDTLANFFAGLRILAARQIRPGDFVQLDSGQQGIVEDVTWGYTAIRQLPNLLTVVPNAKLASAIVTNCTLPDPEVAVLVKVGVAYASDLARVEQVTIDVAGDVMRTVEGGIPTFEPFIRYNEFGDSSINFTVIMRGREFTSRFLITHEFVKRLQARFARERIEIPFPQRVVHVAGGLPAAPPA